ncbi:MAG TPA: NUDIX domain-containing protein [Anaerolineae bacterium]|nr:NUDIX domain-containing protein [Anaerolineae bacterium]
MLSNDFIAKYPHLFQEVIWPWGPTRARFVLLESIPSNRQIANVNIGPRTGNGWVTIRLKDGSWEIPGGTLKPHEEYIDTARRELMEEVGAQLTSRDGHRSVHISRAIRHRRTLSVGIRHRIRCERTELTQSDVTESDTPAARRRRAGHFVAAGKS